MFGSRRRVNEGIEMIKMEPCKGCGGLVLMGDLAPGVTLKVDPARINAQTLGARLMLGETDQLWTIRYDTAARMVGFSPADFTSVGALSSPTPPHVVSRHSCPKARSGDLTASQRSEAPRVPSSAPGLPAAPSTPSVEPSTESSTRASARRAVIPASDRFAQGGGPRCAECSEPMADGTYFAIELGELMQYAAHVNGCTG